jgi:hypothetical protein
MNIFKAIKEKKVKKLILVSFLTMLIGNSANASIISIITGADMAGMEVTVTFDGGSTETVIWDVISAGNGLTDTVNLETASGGVTGSGFSLTQQGNSLGNVNNNDTPTDSSDDIFYGLWTLTNMSQSAITKLFVNALAGGIVFDTDNLDNSILNGSDVGRPFEPRTGGPTAIYSNNYQDELFGAMTVELSLASDASLDFFADTDAITVSAPSTISILMLSLFGFVMNARRKQA